MEANSKPMAWAISIIIGGGFGLALASLFLPYDFPGLLAFGLGAAAVIKVFWTPGRISYKRDLVLWGGMILMLIFTRVSLLSLCLRLFFVNERCQPAFIEATMLGAKVCVIISLLLLWPWLRLQSRRQYFSNVEN